MKEVKTDARRAAFEALRLRLQAINDENGQALLLFVELHGHWHDAGENTTSMLSVNMEAIDCIEFPTGTPWTLYWLRGRPQPFCVDARSEVPLRLVPDETPSST